MAFYLASNRVFIMFIICDYMPNHIAINNSWHSSLSYLWNSMYMFSSTNQWHFQMLMNAIYYSTRLWPNKTNKYSLLELDYILFSPSHTSPYPLTINAHANLTLWFLPRIEGGTCMIFKCCIGDHSLLHSPIQVSSNSSHFDKS